MSKIEAYRILKDLKYEIWYSPKFETIYIYPPVKVRHLSAIKKYLEYYEISVKNIVIGRLYENYL